MLTSEGPSQYDAAYPFVVPTFFCIHSAFSLIHVLMAQDPLLLENSGNPIYGSVGNMAEHSAMKASWVQMSPTDGLMFRALCSFTSSISAAYMGPFAALGKGRREA